MFCPQPFEQIEIYENGDVYTCCPNFINFFSIGNIYHQCFDEIWNGEKALNFRKKILSGDFSLCSNNCNRKTCLNEQKDYLNEKVTMYPREIAVSSDKSCNVQCKICRDKLINIKHNENNIKEEIEKYWLPIFKDAQIIRFGCTGEPFFSVKEKLMIKMVADSYPKVKFDFHTNGILGNEVLLKELNVYSRMREITVSVHAATEKTYNSIVNAGNYKKVLENLNLYSKMKKNNLLHRFRLIFVVMSYNYNEMVDFAKLSQELGADVEFWAYRKNDTMLSNIYNEVSVVEKSNPSHNDLLKILENPIFDSQNVTLYPELKNLR